MEFNLNIFKCFTEVYYTPAFNGQNYILHTLKRKILTLLKMMTNLPRMLRLSKEVDIIDPKRDRNRQGNPILQFLVLSKTTTNNLLAILFVCHQLNQEDGHPFVPLKHMLPLHL